VIDLVRGVSQPGDRDLVEGEPSSAMGQLHAVAGLALFFSIGGHRLVVRAFAEGLDAVPLGGVALSRGGLMGFVTLSGEALLFGVALAFPACAAVLLVEVFLGLVARAAPTLPVFHAGMPLRALAGLFAVTLSLGAGLAALSGQLARAASHALAWLSAAP
jgi:flagellar biosynthesis protein FliR